MLIVHVITGLNDGGAEAALYRLCKFDKLNRHYVISLMDYGKYGPMLKRQDVSVLALGMQQGEFSFLRFLKLIIALKQINPDVVQTWMYHADLLGGVAARLAGIKSVVWGIHNTILEHGKSKKSTIFISKALARLSWWIPKKIIACAQRALDVHVSLGYDRSKMYFIPNGYDLVDFQPGLDPLELFKASSVSGRSTPLIGMVGRFDPMKDHANLLDALVILRNSGIKFNCILVGTGLDSSNEEIKEWIFSRKLVDVVHLLGQRADIPQVMNALDLHILPSIAEAFPNVVAEAMACGIPCVVTDVGDAAYIVDDTGWIVPPRDANALAEAIASALLEISDLCKINKRRLRSRKRIEELFSIDKMMANYLAIWCEVVCD